jgi:ribose 5-phosphate isomerase B
MKVYIGADHRGFELKQQLIPWLTKKGHDVIDCGNTVLDPLDDFPDFSFAVAEKVADDPASRGIIICGSGGGVTIAANKVVGIRCGTVSNADEVKHNRENNDVNMIALASDYTPFKESCEFADIFLTTAFKGDEKYTRRIQKISTYESACCGGGCGDCC